MRFVPTIPNTEIDGELKRLGFRYSTAAGRTTAIKEFQRSWHLGSPLSIDGLWGPKTNAAMIETKRRGDRVSEHFKYREFDCKCGGKYASCRGIRLSRKEVYMLEQVRSMYYPRGLVITSAYRCTGHNRAVGGASKSQHLYGRAFDIPSVIKVGSKLPDTIRGIGKRRGYISHIDTRPTSRLAVWNY